MNPIYLDVLQTFQIAMQIAKLINVKCLDCAISCQQQLPVMKQVKYCYHRNSVSQLIS